MVSFESVVVRLPPIKMSCQMILVGLIYEVNFR